jgi:hypothetical protein
MIRKSHFLLALALALAAAAIGVPVAQAAVKSPYEFLGHPISQGGVDRVSAAAVKSPYEFLGHPTSQGGVDRVPAAAVSAAAVKSPYEFLGHPTSQGGVDRVSAAAGRPLAASTSSPQVAGSTVFQWGDAGIGAGFAFGIVLLVGGAGAGLLISRRNGRQQAARS